MCHKEEKEKKDLMDMVCTISKIAALSIPAIISITVFTITLFNFKGNTTDLGTLETKLNMGLSIIGIAITVWVGLNIYDLIEKKELDELKIKVDGSLKRLQYIEPKMLEFESRMEEDEKIREYIMLLQKWLEFNERSLTALHEETIHPRIYHNMDAYIDNFTNLIDFNSKLKCPNLIHYFSYYKTLLFWISKVMVDHDVLILEKNLYTNDKITIEDIKEKIDKAISSLYSIQINYWSEMLIDLAEKKSSAINYSDIINLLNGVKLIASKTPFKINVEQIDEIIYKIDDALIKIRKNAFNS